MGVIELILSLCRLGSGGDDFLSVRLTRVIDMNNKQPTDYYLTLSGEINQEMVPKALETLSGASQRGAKTIHLLIQSNGGYIGDGVGLYNFIRNFPAEIITYNCGHVASIAVLVFLAGKRRIAATTATFMIHKSVRNGLPPGINAVRMREIMRSLDADDMRVEGILREHVSLSPQQWEAHANSDLNFTASEALNSGIIHQIGDFAPPLGSQIYAI